MPPPSNPIAERAAYVEGRAQELIRRGLPKDDAVAKASGEWFNHQLAADDRAEQARRFEQQKVDAQLAKMERAKREAK